MSILNPLYHPLYTLSEGSILDKDSGSPLAGGIVRFYRDSSRNTFKEVYQLTGTSPDYTFVSLGYTLTLSDIGTFVDDQGNPVVPYLYPYDSDGNVDLYYATCYSSLDGVTPAVFQFDVEAIPYLDGSGSENAGINFENELSNPQFVEVNFYPTATNYVYTIASSATVPVAPNWDIVVSGAGTLTVKRVAITPGNIPTDPPYALEINSTGFTGGVIRLRQRLLGNSYIFTNGALSGYFIANSQDGATHSLAMTFNQSNGTPTDTTIITGSISSSGSWVEAKGSVELDVSTSTDTAPTGYVDIDVLIPVGAHIQITSLQLVSTAAVLSDDNNLYDQTTINRQEDHLAHYYKPQLAYKPIPSYTLGWDFRFNPCQQLGTSVSAVALGANQSRYIADQTIAFEAVSNALSYSFSSASGLTVSTTSTTQFAIIQYLDANTARSLLSGRNSVQIKARCSSGTLNGTINLYWSTDPSFPVLTNVSTTQTSGNSIVAGMTAGAASSFNGNWTKVSRGYLNDAAFTLTTTNQTIDFSWWDASSTAASTTATFMAIVIGFDSMTASQTAIIDYCTLNAGDIPTRPSPLTSTETLNVLQQYYETSWNTGTAIGTTTEVGSTIRPCHVTSGNVNAYPMSFSFDGKVVKRTAVTPVLYPTVTASGAGFVTAFIYRDGVFMGQSSAAVAGNWTFVGASQKYYAYQAASGNVLVSQAPGGVSVTANLEFHYILDARFGVA